MQRYYHRGVPVPYVTKWEHEGLKIPLEILDQPNGTALIRYSDETAYDRRYGVLWCRDGAARGSGEPQWSHIHTARHRRVMTQNRCQICGEKAAGAGEPVPWLLPTGEYELHQLTTDAPITSTAPTCRECWTTARLYCPHLRDGGMVACVVDEVRPWGALAQVYRRGAAPTLEQLSMSAAARLPALAMQLAVELRGITRVEL